MATTAVPFTQVRFTDVFWRPRLETNHRVTLPIQYEQCRKTGRLDAFKLNWRSGDANPPHIFWDSDVAKWIEAVAYALAARPDPELQACVESVIVDIAAAQQPDGYLNTHFVVVEPEKRWTNVRDLHELYCAGHLMEAAVAWFDATGQRTLLDTMVRYADHIATVFGRGPGQRRGYPGHEEIELALVKLHRVTGEARFLELATYFVDERGAQPLYYEVEAAARGEAPTAHAHHQAAYSQAHIPVREQSVVTGHAVRAMYLYSGMADVAAATGDATLLAACKRLWSCVTERRMHVTGGIGPSPSNEGFTEDYDLPDEGAYLETCAAIGLAFWAHRMLQAEPDRVYADVLERALYNGILSGVSLAGDRFFYGNPLATHPGWDGNNHFVGEGYHYGRSEWFGCACCPPNIARLLAQLPGYVYSTAPDEVYVHLYVQSEARLAVAGGEISLRQETTYPWDEKVTLTIRSAEPEMALPGRPWALRLRVPGWCRRVRVQINGQHIQAATYMERGYVVLRHSWSHGDTVTLTLAMPVERIAAHPAARQMAGRVALQRGPVVYCMEEADNGANVHDLRLSSDVGTTADAITVVRDPARLNGVPLLQVSATRTASGTSGHVLYRSLSVGVAGSSREAVTATAVPYFLWGNRTLGGMRVWLQEG